MRTTTLKDRPGYRLTLHQHAEDSEVLLVSFGSVGSGISRKGFGTNLAKKYGYDNVYVAQRRGSQYQELQAEEFREALAPYLDQYGRVVAYGASLGGYAAVYFGGPIGAHIVAVSPHNSAHPLIDRSSFTLLPFTHREISENPASPHAPIIVTDPTRHDDQEFIDRLILPAYPDLRRVEFPYASHSVLESFKEQGSVSALVRPMIERGEVPAIELNHEGSATWHSEKGRVLAASGETAKAEQHLRAALEIKPDKKGAARSLVQVLAAQGRTEEIQQLQETLQNQVTRRWLPFPAGWTTGRVSTPKLPDRFNRYSRAVTVEPGASRRVAEQPGYLITLTRRKNPTDTLLIAFPRAFTDKAKAGLGTRFARREGYDYLYVSQRKASFYQELPLEAFRAAAEPYLHRYRRIIALGIGAGGYAALYYAAGLGNAQVLAFNPFHPKHPELTGRQYGEDGFYHQPMTGHASTAEISVVYDPASRKQSRFIAKAVTRAYPEANLLEFPGSGASTLDALRKSGTAAQVLRSLINSEVRTTENLKTLLHR